MQLGDTLHLNIEVRETYGQQCTMAMSLGALSIPAVGFIMGEFQLFRILSLSSLT